MLPIPMVKYLLKIAVLKSDTIFFIRSLKTICPSTIKSIKYLSYFETASEKLLVWKLIIYWTGTSQKQQHRLPLITPT